MTAQLKSINTSILFSALVTFALITGQPHSSNASEQLNHDEMIDHVYTPAWMGSNNSVPGPQDEVKSESQSSSEQLELRDEMIDHVYTPLWMGSIDPAPGPQDEVKSESRSTNEQLELRDEMIDHVYTPLWMGDPS